MAKSAAAKTLPVAIGTTLENLAAFRDLSDEKAAIEKKMETLKPYIVQLVPGPIAAAGKASFEATRHNVKGEYVVTRVRRDGRKLDDDLVMKLLDEYDLVSLGTKQVVVPDHDRVVALIESGQLPKAKFAKCLVGPVSIYPLVDFKKTK